VLAISVTFYARAWRAVPVARPLIRRYALGFSVASLFWLASAFVPPPYRYGLWLIGLALEFYVPLSTASRRLQYLLPPDPGHVAERYGLFTIIVLGESFIKVVSGLADRGPTPDALVLTAVGFVIAASVWWMYFDHTLGAMLRSTPTARYLWIYGHLPLTLGVTGIGVGLKKLTALSLSEPASDPVRWVIAGAVALCLLAFAMLDGVRGGSKPAVVVGARMAAAAAVVGVMVLGSGLSALAVAVLLAAVCTALVVLTALDQRASAGAHHAVSEGAPG
jgi:low temperature requirement protein LtrA